MIIFLFKVDWFVVEFIIDWVFLGILLIWNIYIWNYCNFFFYNIGIYKCLLWVESILRCDIGYNVFI